MDGQKPLKTVYSWYTDWLTDAEKIHSALEDELIRHKVIKDGDGYRFIIYADDKYDLRIVREILHNVY